MPVLSRFYGITVKMYLLGKEHNPPHIHAIYGDYNAVMDIQTLKILEGDLPGKGAAMLKEWAALYQAELLDIWNTQEFRTLPPLQ
jgi:predicted alternative tryptophan synthase beta-subunit